MKKRHIKHKDVTNTEIWALGIILALGIAAWIAGFTFLVTQ